MDKLYNISKTAEILDVTPKTLRIWDKEGKLKPVLTSGGHRRYKESDINNLIENKETLYFVTQKHIICEHRCSAHTLIECINCHNYFEFVESTSKMTIDELTNTINSGNCYITKVEKI